MTRIKIQNSLELQNLHQFAGSFGEGNVNPLQYSCLENPMDRRTWWATVHRVAQSWTQLKQLSSLKKIAERLKSRFVKIQLVKQHMGCILSHRLVSSQSVIPCSLHKVSFAKFWK